MTSLFTDASRLRVLVMERRVVFRRVAPLCIKQLMEEFRWKRR